MRTGIIFVLVGALTVVAACDDPSGPAPITELPRELTVAEMDVIEGSNAFALALLDEIRTEMPDSPNTFLSPLSASMALGMTMNGAAGDTWAQMAATLGFAGMDEQTINEAYQSLIALLLELDPAVEIGLGNAVWVDEISLLPGFVDRTETYFDAEVDTLDFDDPSSADVMNGWVSDVTMGRIDRLVESVNPDALLYLINAIYFKADWRSAFDDDNTFDGRFTMADGTGITVPMMSDELGYRTLNAGNANAVQGVELPYAGGAYGAVVLLPPEGQSVDDFVAAIDGVMWAGWMETFEEAAEAEDLDSAGLLIRMPRFELEWGASLKPALQAMGMPAAFNPQQADLTRITTDRGDLFIFDVRQKTFVRVDEQGTEAAAATSVVVGFTSAPTSISFNRPFLFAIRERFSGTILFMGVIGDPGG